MLTAVGKREDAIIATTQKYSTAVLAALNTRKTELLAAWNITNAQDRNKARNEVWVKYIKTKMGAREVYRSELQTEWGTFRADRATCGHGPTGEDPEVDNSL
jgi:hypothetical protein